MIIQLDTNEVSIGTIQTLLRLCIDDFTYQVKLPHSPYDEIRDERGVRVKNEHYEEQVKERKEALTKVEQKIEEFIKELGDDK